MLRPSPVLLGPCAALFASVQKTPLSISRSMFPEIRGSPGLLVGF